MGEAIKFWEMDVGFEIQNFIGDFFMAQAVFNQPWTFDINMLDDQNIHKDSPKSCGNRRILIAPAVKMLCVLFKGAILVPFVEMLKVIWFLLGVLSGW